jgi:hypothetical protein
MAPFRSWPVCVVHARVTERSHSPIAVMNCQRITYRKCETQGLCQDRVDAYIGVADVWLLFPSLPYTSIDEACVDCHVPMDHRKFYLCYQKEERGSMALCICVTVVVSVKQLLSHMRGYTSTSAMTSHRHQSVT